MTWREGLIVLDEELSRLPASYRSALILCYLEGRRQDNAARLQLFALAYNLVNALRQLALPPSIRSWNLTTLREKLVKIGAKVVGHAQYVVLQLAEVAIPRRLCAGILERIGRLRLAEASG
jgi:hypothetical protein